MEGNESIYRGYCNEYGILLFYLPKNQKKWTSNFGIEAGGGYGGLSVLKASENPLVKTDLQGQGFYSAGFYTEFLQLEQRKQNSIWGNVKPSWGLKTGINWSFTRADNSANGGGNLWA